MSKNFYYVEKSTGTAADTLLAFGLADLLNTLLPNANIVLEDIGDSYRIGFGAPAEWYAYVTFQHLCPGLNTDKKLSPIAYEINYLDEKKKNERYYAALCNKLDSETMREQGLQPPHPNWPVWAIINQMSAIDGYHKQLSIWNAHQDCFTELMAIIDLIFANRPNQLAEGEAAWKRLAKQYGFPSSAISQLQVVNPGMGKGANRSKADGLSIGGLKGFWLVEYLKFAGLYQASLPRTVSGVKDRKADRKTYIVCPKRLSWQRHLTVFDTFRSSFFAESAIKMDIIAALRYCQIFVEQWKEGQSHQSKSRYSSGNPTDHVAAFETIFYKHLGSAHATLNLSTIVLPGWTKRVTTTEEAAQLLSLLQEHRTIIYSLRENQGDAHKLLQLYRRFLSGRELHAFFDFCRRYGSYVMSEYVKGNIPKLLTTINLEVLMKNHPQSDKLAPIIENESFLRLAAAIRASTVTPQYFKAKGTPGPYDIRYGLGQDLMRNASYPRKFIVALSKFAQSYMQENGRVNERYNGSPPINRTQIREGDLQEIIALIDNYDSETVASLLVAFGYANKLSAISEEQE